LRWVQLPPGKNIPFRSNASWHERRDLYPSDSVLLWTRRPQTDHDTVQLLHAEVAEDESFDPTFSAKGETPRLESQILAGDPRFSI
jgi:hypothetical protein